MILSITKLYGDPIRPTTQMALVCFAEKGHEPDFARLDLMKEAHKSAESLARHPFGLTPVVEDGDVVLHQARAILRYLDRALSGPSLTPTKARDYARMGKKASRTRSSPTSRASI